MNAAAALTLGQADLTKIVSESLREEFGGTDAAIKRIMDAANCNERAARNWYEGRNAPNALYLLRLMATVPPLQARVRELTGMLSDLDPRFERAFNETLAIFQQTHARPRERFCLPRLRLVV